MQQSIKVPFLFYLTILSLLMFTPSDTRGEATESRSSSRGALQQRIDFGNSQILGQSIKSGAVYLMHRKKSDITTMIEVRQHYRNEIKEDFDIGKTVIVQKNADSCEHQLLQE